MHSTTANMTVLLLGVVTLAGCQSQSGAADHARSNRGQGFSVGTMSDSRSSGEEIGSDASDARRTIAYHGHQPSEGTLASQADQDETGEGATGNDITAETPDAVVIEATNQEYPFSARAIRFHPFTRVRRGTVDGGDAKNSPVMIEVRLEFFDQFGDPTKAIGSLRFELYESEPGRASVPIPGRRLMKWDPSFELLDVNSAHYDRITRTYVFRLDTSELAELPEQSVIIATYHTKARRLAAQFDLALRR